MDKTKYNITPTPWKAFIAPNGGWTIRAVYMNDENRRCTAFLAVCSCGGQDNEANAKFIARAVNSHADLLAALKEARRAIDEIIPGTPCRKRIDAAIILAESDINTGSDK